MGYGGHAGQTQKATDDVKGGYANADAGPNQTFQPAHNAAEAAMVEPVLR